MEAQSDSETKNQYNEHAKVYSDDVKSIPIVLYVESPHIHKLIGEVEGKNILDFGCGTGNHLVTLSKKNPNLLAGVDFSEEFISMAKESLKHFDSSKLILEVNDLSIPKFYKNFQENSFDVIFSNWVVVHMDNLEKLEIYLQNMFNLLKQGGQAQVLQGDFKVYVENDVNVEHGVRTLPSSSEWTDGMPLKNTFGELVFHDHYWKAETIMELMKKIGFSKVERVDTTGVDENHKELCEMYNKIKAIYSIVGTK